MFLLNRLFIAVLLIALTTTIYGQSVGINSTGNAPNGAALLDISDDDGTPNSGILIPRMTAAQRGAITLSAAAQGLMVYQTDGSQGFYYNISTNTTPNWIRLSAADEGWLLSGNAGTTAGTNFLGTTDAIDLVLKTNNTEKVRIESGGDVGIGTGSIDAKLEVSGDIMSTSSNARLRLMRTDGANYLDFENSNNLHIREIDITDAADAISTTFEPGGNVGIGTTDPEELLHVESTTANPTIIIDGNNGASDLDPGLEFHLDDALKWRFYTDDSQSDRFIFDDDEGSQPVLVFQDDGSNARIGMGELTPDAHFEISANLASPTLDLLMVNAQDNDDGEYFIVKNDGDVGIGNNSPSNKLEVMGEDDGNELDVVQIRNNANSNGTATTLKLVNSSTSGADVGAIEITSERTASGTLLKFRSHDGGSMTERMRLDEDGNLGIGDQSPASLLTVGDGDLFQVNSSGNIVKINDVTYSFPGAAGAANTLLLNDGSGNLSWQTYVPGNLTGSGTATRVAFWDGASSLSSNADLYWDNGSNELGVGTTSPSNKFEVNTALGSSGIDIDNTAGDGDPVVRFQLSNSTQFTMGIDDGDGDAFKIASAASLGTGSDYLKITSSDVFSLGSGEEFQVNSSGNLTKINDVTYSWPGAQGAANQILINNGSGTLSWSNASGLVTASNGLTSTGGATPDIQLGGTLSSETTITQGTNSMIFDLTSTGDFEVRDNGSTHLLVRDNGDVGIGVSPTVKLDIVTNDGSDGIDIDNTALDGDPLLRFQLSDVTQFSMGVDDGNSDNFKIAAAATLGTASDLITIESGGNVGIGTTDPDDLLHVGDGTGSPGIIIDKAEAGVGTLYFNRSGGTASANIRVGSSEALTIENDKADADIQFRVNDSDGDANEVLMYLDASQPGVGIGTISPGAYLGVGTSAQFQVNSSGNLTKINDVDYSWPGAQGAANQLLLNDGAGTLSWSNASDFLTASNGLTSSGGATPDIELGGDLTSNTTIQNESFNLNFDLNGTGDLHVIDGATTYFTVLNTGNVGIGTAAPSTDFEILNDDATDNAIEDLFDITKNTSGTPAAGIGAGINFNIQDAGGTEEQGSIALTLDNVTDAAEEASLTFNVNQAGTLGEVMRIDGTAGNVGINTTAPDANYGLEVQADGESSDFAKLGGEDYAINAEVNASGESVSLFTHTSSANSNNYFAVGGNLSNASNTDAFGYLGYHKGSGDNAYGIYSTGGDYGGYFENAVGIGDDTPNSTLEVAGSFSRMTEVLTVATTLDDTHDIVLVNAAAAISITLPTAVGITGRTYTIKKTDAIGANIVTIDGDGTETIDGVATRALANQYEYIVIVSDGANWLIISNNIGL